MQQKEKLEQLKSESDKKPVETAAKKEVQKADSDNNKAKKVAKPEFIVTKDQTPKHIEVSEDAQNPAIE